AIVEALSARSDWDVARTMALQTDQRSLAWRDLREAVLAVPSGGPLARQGLGGVRSGGGGGAAGRVGAAGEALFAGAVFRGAAQGAKSWEWALGRGLSLLNPFNFFGYRRAGHLVRMLRRQPTGWFERSWPEEMADALATAVRQLRQMAGDDPRQWAWGRLRPL